MVAQDLTSAWIRTVSSEFAGFRLDAFIRAQLSFLSRRQLEDTLGKGLFAINGRRARKGDRLRSGDVVEFTGPATWLSSSPLPNPNLLVPIVYEDMDLLALNKPAGMDCHGFSGRDDATLVNFLVAGWPEQAGVGSNRWEAGLVHRLDRETSGLVLAAKNTDVFDDLRRQFRGRAIKKKYLALVWGSSAKQGEIAFPLAHDSKDNRKMRAIYSKNTPASHAKIWRALTRYRKLRAHQGLSLVEIEMITGVTHQIRVHLAAIGHPVVGDMLYGDERESFGLRRHFLHASELGFTHPGSKSVLGLEAPLPPELAMILERMQLKP